MTQLHPRHSERRGGAPAGYQPVGVREWPAGGRPLGIPLRAGMAMPAVMAAAWAAIAAEAVTVQSPAPWWVLWAFAIVGLAQTGWSAATTRQLNRWHNAWLFATDRHVRIHMPMSWLPGHVRRQVNPDVIP